MNINEEFFPIRFGVVNLVQNIRVEFAPNPRVLSLQCSLGLQDAAIHIVDDVTLSFLLEYFFVLALIETIIDTFKRYCFVCKIGEFIVIKISGILSVVP
jgi:hypothetical protein